MQLQELVSTISSTATIGAMAGAAWWFFATSKVKPRLQFDLECEFHRDKSSPQQVIAELQFVFTNTGFVEHKIWTLETSIHAPFSGESSNDNQSCEILFDRALMKRKNIVPSDTGYYFVRPGVRQVITHIASIPSDTSLIRVTSGFKYHKEDDTHHTAQRLFTIPFGDV